MIFRNYNTIPVLFGGLLFAFASKCIPTFFSLFLADKGYGNTDVILISTLFFVGGLFANPNIFKNKISSKIFQIASAIGAIILHLQMHMYLIAGWFTFRFLQGFLDVISRNSLNNLVPDRYILSLNFFMNIGSSMGFLLMCFPELYNLIFTITGISLNLSIISMAFQKDNREYHKLIEIKQEKVFKNWVSIFQTNSILFFAMILTTLLTATLNTILPITLRNNGFVNTDILKIMFVGSIGNAILQIVGNFLKNTLGLKNFLRFLLILLPFLYFGTLFLMFYRSLITVFFVFFIFGIHNLINNTIAGIFREEEGVSYRMARAGINQINNIGSILSSMISLIFLTFSPRYGLFILWLLSILFIWIILNSFKNNKNKNNIYTYN